MSERLPSPDFDSQNYERPNQKWICGHAAEGKPCRRGPDHRGHCGATAECVPVLETKPGETKGRWRCTRSGGPCESGPLPDGTCCRPVVKCSPVPTMRTTRGRFTRAVVVATIGLLLVLLGSPPLRNRFINPGELSSAHSGEAFAKLSAGTNQLNQTCAACHAAGAAGPSGIMNAVFRATPGPMAIPSAATLPGMTAIDGACQNCHTSHGFHQPNVVQDLSCSACHAEHRGTGRMAVPTDAHCAICHGDAAVMSAAAAKGAQLPMDVFQKAGLAGASAVNQDRLQSTTSPRPSPPFHGGEGDGTLGGIKSPGITRPSSGFMQVIHSFAADHPEFRAHADKWSDPNTLKFGHALHLTGGTIPQLPNGRKLDCAFCHQPDAAGAYFRPVQFENHCRVCHSLQFDPETPELTLPHGDPDFVSAFLHSLPKQYADYVSRSGARGEQQKEIVQDKLRRFQARAVSGEEFERRVFFSSAMTGPPAQVGTVSGSTRALYPGCAYCHEVKSNPQGRPEITRPVIFDRWLVHGRFNHSAHSKIACALCHQAEQSRVTSDIILPTKNSCVSCHSPQGGVVDSCVTCHTYHNAR